MASVATASASTPSERRLRAEWALLHELAARNPGRLTDLAADDCTLRVTLHGTPAPLPGGGLLSTHGLRVEYPRFFPALPLELYLDTPVFHPNVHPETGFVCLWERHQAAHTVEDALHKTAGILGWRVFNLRPEHTMQPDAASLAPDVRAQLSGQLATAPLLGVQGATPYPPPPRTTRRRRLS